MPSPHAAPVPHTPLPAALALAPASAPLAEASLTDAPPAAASLMDAVEWFIGRTRHTRSGSPHTERAYRSDLRHFEAFLATLDRPFEAVSRRDAERYLLGLSADGAPRTVRRRVSCLRSFYRFLRGLDLVAQNPFDALDLPGFDRRSETHKVLSLNELGCLTTLLESDTAEAYVALHEARLQADRMRAFLRLFVTTRRRAALSLMAFGGLRASEVLALRASGLEEHADGLCLTFTGKGAKIRRVPLAGAAYPALGDWLAVRRHLPSAHAATVPQRSRQQDRQRDRVFVTLNGNPVRYRQLARDCDRLGERVGTRYRLTPHVLRRTFATRTHATTGNLRAVQDLLGHASIQTTEIYTHVDPSSLRALVEATFPSA